jgi:hypothetical protein
LEDKANGPAVIKRLRHTVSGVVEVEPEGGKIARMFAASGEWQAGDWYVDRNAAWAEPFIQQITMFPGAAHDDMADMMSQASIWLQAHGGGLVELWRQQYYEEIKAKENGHGNGNGSNGHATPEEMPMQPGADDSRFARASWPKSLGKGDNRSAADAGLYES